MHVAHCIICCDYAAPPSRVKHSTTEPLRYLYSSEGGPSFKWYAMLRAILENTQFAGTYYTSTVNSILHKKLNLPRLKTRLGPGLPSLVSDTVISSFHNGFIFAKHFRETSHPADAKFHENKTLAKIS